VPSYLITAVGVAPTHNRLIAPGAILSAK